MAKFIYKRANIIFVKHRRCLETISQQIFVSHSTWELVKTSKEELIKLINIAATKVPGDAPSNELAMMILNIVGSLDKKMPSEVAIEYAKKEIAKIL